MHALFCYLSPVASLSLISVSNGTITQLILHSLLRMLVTLSALGLNTKKYFKTPARIVHVSLVYYLNQPAHLATVLYGRALFPKLTVAFSSISPSQYGYFDVGMVFQSSHIQSARRLTYNWVSIALCVITVELTALYFCVYVLQVLYYRQVNKRGIWHEEWLIN